MKQLDPQKVEDIFNAALELPADQRARFLSGECGDDVDLREEVESLLDSYKETFLERNVSVKALELIRGGLSPGDVIRKQYKIIKMIGSGGMGEVYLAEDTKLKRNVALKVLAENFSRDKKRVETFKNEAHTASQINHQNILTIHDFIIEEGDASFIIMEFIEGETLRKKLQSNPLDLSATLNITRQIASALEAAHKRGVIHRDIKPENIIINDDGLVKILDFGIAKLTERESPEEEIITQGLSRVEVASGFGTASYMSPEQVHALYGDQGIDARSDIWGLGVCLYEMLTGVMPFKGETRIDTFAAILKDEPAPLEETVPAGLKVVVSKALQKDRDDRYQTMREFRLDLETLKHQPDNKLVDANNGMKTFDEWRRASGKTISRTLLCCVLLCLLISLALTAFPPNVFNNNYSGEELEEAAKQITAQNLVSSENENKQAGQDMKNNTKRGVSEEEIKEAARNNRINHAARMAQATGCIFHLILISITFYFLYKNPGPKRFRRVENDIENGRLKPNITYSTGYVEVSDWKRARDVATAALKNYREPYVGLLFAWIFLYSCVLWRFFDDGHLIKSLLTQANNFNTLCIWLCFRILNEPITTENKSQNDKGIIITESLKVQTGVLLITFGIMVLWFVLEFSLTNSRGGQADFIHTFSKLMGGIFGGVAMALFVGRFQSKFLKSPNWLIVVLFLYTVIQALFIFYGEKSVEAEIWAAGVIQVALFLKCLLILYMFWLFQSGRLLFYLVRVRRAHNQVDDEWKHFREVLQQES